MYIGEPYDEPDVQWISNQTIKIGNIEIDLRK